MIQVVLGKLSPYIFCFLALLFLFNIKNKNKVNRSGVVLKGHKCLLSM